MARNTKKFDLSSVEGNLCFWINNGPILRNLKELRDALGSISEESFKFHVNKEKNDFAAWVKDALKDETLSKRLLKVKTLKAFIKAVEDRLKKYNI